MNYFSLVFDRRPVQRQDSGIGFLLQPTAVPEVSNSWSTTFNSNHDSYRRTLDTLFNHLPAKSLSNLRKISFLVSQDGEPRSFSATSAHAGVSSVIDSFVKQATDVGFSAQRQNHPQISNSEVKAMFDKAVGDWVLPYARLSLHYKWALHKAFVDLKAERVIILEDDMVSSTPVLIMCQRHLTPEFSVGHRY